MRFCALPALCLAAVCSAAGAAGQLPRWSQPYLDPLSLPYGGAKLLSNETQWTRLFYGTLQPGTGA